ncbi:MAG: hypothetical protein IJZ13_00415, partial [Clostridia bacterium]|nr:hypothetical protein [Clostridia bacterium]
PAKMEVRFINEKPTYDAEYYGVKTALQSGDSRVVQKPAERPVPAVPSAEQLYFRSPEPEIRPVSTVPITVNKPVEKRIEEPVISVPPTAPFVKKALTPTKPVSSDIALHDCVSGDSTVSIPAVLQPPVSVSVASASLEEAVPEPSAPALPAVELTTEPEKSVKLVGEAFDTYIFAEYDGVLYCIDKHAAHERMLYNELVSRQQQEVQLLLAPVSVSLKKEEFGALMEEKEALYTAGFEVEDFGDSTLLVRSVPMMLTGCDIADVMQEIAGGLLSGRREITTNKQDWIYHSTACRAAIKAGNKSHPRELEELARRVLQNDDIRYCPHGRPVCIHWSRNDLEKLFGRV